MHEEQTPRDCYLPVLALVPLPYVHPWKEKASRKASPAYKPPPSLSLGGARETLSLGFGICPEGKLGPLRRLVGTLGVGTLLLADVTERA